MVIDTFKGKTSIHTWFEHKFITLGKKKNVKEITKCLTGFCGRMYRE